MSAEGAPAVVEGEEWYPGKTIVEGGELVGQTLVEGGELVGHTLVEGGDKVGGPLSPACLAPYSCSVILVWG